MAKSALHISTTNAGIHPQDPDEQTAHPSRIPGSRPSGDSQTESTMSLTSSVSAQQPPESSSASDLDAAFPGLTRSLTHQERELLAHLDRLKFFLATAPSRWSSDSPTQDPASLPLGHPNSAHPALNRFLLPNSEYVSCVLWGGLYHITGTDIVRALVFRFEAFGRPVKNMKKFEEGVFSDLRNLKPGIDACLEEPKSPFLDLLFKYQCIRTQKKQKVFYWFSVPHDRLFLDALERDLKREKMGLEPTTLVGGEPALSFTYDPKRSLYDQFSKAQGAVEGEGELEAAVRRVEDDLAADDSKSSTSASNSDADIDPSSSEADESNAEDNCSSSRPTKKKSALNGPNSPFFSMFSIFEGSPTYKQRRKKLPKGLPQNLNGSRRSPSSMPYGHSSLRNSPDDYMMNGVYGGMGMGVGSYRMPEPHMDRFGRDTTRMSAADMFMAQARGDFNPQSNPDLVATQKERQRRAMQAAHGAQVLSGPGVAGGRLPPTPPGTGNGAMGFGVASQPQSLHPSMMMNSDALMNAAYPPGRPHAHVEHRHHTFPMAPASGQQLRSSTQPFTDPSSSSLAGWGVSMSSEPMPIPRTKAFVCPLFSCGRMFKRMEHLKRHLRTHTLERPYQCSRCKKRFSRSDNLNQHYRTHLRSDGSSGMSGADNGTGADADVESEEVDELEGDDGGLEDAMYGMGMGGMNELGGFTSIPDVQMCEVEIQGSIQEVQGDEEGLVLPTGSVQQTQSVTAVSSADVSPDGQDVYYANGDDGSTAAQWAAAGVSGSLPSQPRPISAIGAATPAYLSDYVSMSAPANKVAFDHSALYPPELNVTGTGPIRRHRSATPSVGRYGDNIRRPYSAVSDQGSTGSTSSSRSYHPYAVAHSADSSPMTYNVPLEYDSVSRSGTHSRSSSSGQQLQDQMHQMLNLEQLDDGMAAAYAHEPNGYGAPAAYHRTDSPMQFAPQEVQDNGAAGMYAMSNGTIVDAQPQFADTGYYQQVGM